ncbi:MAG: hypothetical protein ACUVQY_05630 [Thermoproteota archaeon]
MLVGGYRYVGGNLVQEPGWGPGGEFFLGNPTIAVPGHYEDVSVLVPEHGANYRVLFPAYDPIWIEGWYIETNISSTSLTVGEILNIAYEAVYSSIATPPLNATIRLYAPTAFETLND